MLQHLHLHFSSWFDDSQRFEQNIQMQGLQLVRRQICKRENTGVWSNITLGKALVVFPSQNCPLSLSDEDTKTEFQSFLSHFLDEIHRIDA